MSYKIGRLSKLSCLNKRPIVRTFNYLKKDTIKVVFWDVSISSLKTPFDIFVSDTLSILSVLSAKNQARIDICVYFSS
jgi:hypothetical protein